MHLLHTRSGGQYCSPNIGTLSPNATVSVSWLKGIGRVCPQYPHTLVSMRALHGCSDSAFAPHRRAAVSFGCVEAGHTGALVGRSEGGSSSENSHMRKIFAIHCCHVDGNCFTAMCVCVYASMRVQGSAKNLAAVYGFKASYVCNACQQDTAIILQDV